MTSLVGMVDPPREESKAAVADAQAAHIRVRMVTGDDVITGAAIAKQLNIPGEAILGADFAALSEQDRLERIDRIGVVGRVAPEHKVLLAETLKKKGHVVAMTGDGVNDAPAIKAADIGVAMGSGTEVAKNAGRMILSDDNFATIVYAVEQGRKLYDNLSKYIRFVLLELVAFVLTFLGASLFNLAAGQPFTPVQILWINFLVNAPFGVALGFDKQTPGLMDRHPRPRGESILTRGVMITCGLVGLFIAVANLALIAAGKNHYGSVKIGQSMGLVAFSLMLVVAAFEARSETATAFDADIFNSSKMNVIAAAEVAGAFLITQANFMNQLLGTAQLTAAQWGFAFLAAVVLLLGWEAGKWIARREDKPGARLRRPYNRDGRQNRDRPRNPGSHNRAAEVNGDPQQLEIASMAKKKKDKHEKQDAEARALSPAAGQEAEAGPPPKMNRKEYEREMRLLHGELVALQEWVKASGAKICVVFEGRDTAGKGGTIKRITERVSPRVFRVVALPAPTEREKSQMYLQRYVPHLPAAGEVVIFDRSWYNRAGVERVMGFCTPEETDRFLGLVPGVEKAMVDSGILLLKYWLEVSADEQTRRLKSRINDPRKIWKLSSMDLKSYSRWYDYSRARDAMFAATDTAWAPWYIARPTTRSGAGSTSSATCSARSRTSHSPSEDHAAEASTARRILRAPPTFAAHPDAVLDGRGSAMADHRAERLEELIKPLRVKPGSKVDLAKDFDPRYRAGFVKKKDGAELLRAGVELLADYQQRLAAQDTYGVLMCLQALDAGGKDGTIRHVMSGVNPQGVHVSSFKAPSAEELGHDYLWRHARRLPQRGEIGIFNRSHYEEVLVARVHPENPRPREAAGSSQGPRGVGPALPGDQRLGALPDR